MSSLKNKRDISKSMSETKSVNPFDYLPEDKLEIIRKDFEESEISRNKTFEQYLKALHEEDDLIPEEVLDIIEAQKEPRGKTFSTVEELLEDLHKNE